VQISVWVLSFWVAIALPTTLTNSANNPALVIARRRLNLFYLLVQALKQPKQSLVSPLSLEIATGGHNEKTNNLILTHPRVRSKVVDRVEQFSTLGGSSYQRAQDHTRGDRF